MFHWVVSTEWYRKDGEVGDSSTGGCQSENRHDAVQSGDHVDGLTQTDSQTVVKASIVMPRSVYHSTATPITRNRQHWYTNDVPGPSRWLTRYAALSLHINITLTITGDRLCDVKTRSSAVAERPCDASCRETFAKLLKVVQGHYTALWVLLVIQRTPRYVPSCTVTDMFNVEY